MRGTVMPNLPFAPKPRERKVIRVPEVLFTSARSLSGRSVIGPPTLRFAGLQSHQVETFKILCKNRRNVERSSHCRLYVPRSKL